MVYKKKKIFVKQTLLLTEGDKNHISTLYKKKEFIFFIIST